MELYIAFDEDYNFSCADTPEAAVERYTEEYGFYNVNELCIYQKTKLKAKHSVVIADGT